jgi:hypothetical protein
MVFTLANLGKQSSDRRPVLRFTAALLVLALPCTMYGCTSPKTVDLASTTSPASEEIIGVITAAGDTVDFDWDTYGDIRNDTLYATVNLQPYSVALDDVRQLRVYRTNVGLTVGLIAGVIAAFYVVVAASGGVTFGGN